MAISLLLLIAFGALLVLLGLLLMLRPGAIHRLNSPLRQALPGIRASVQVERFYYRHHRVTGPLTVVGGLLLLVTGWTGWYRGSAVEVSVWLDALRWFFLLAGLGVTVLGGVVSVRPSALKRIERWANQPVDRETLLRPMRRTRGHLLRQTTARPRLVGGIIGASGVVVFLLALR